MWPQLHQSGRNWNKFSKLYWCLRVSDFVLFFLNNRVLTLIFWLGWSTCPLLLGSKKSEALLCEVKTTAPTWENERVWRKHSWLPVEQRFSWSRLPLVLQLRPGPGCFHTSWCEWGCGFNPGFIGCWFVAALGSEMPVHLEARFYLENPLILNYFASRFQALGHKCLLD